jgi:hypothetical protein
MTLVEMRPDTAVRSVRLVWFATGDCRSRLNHEAMLGQVRVDDVDLTTAKVDPRDNPATITDNNIIVLPTTLIEVDGAEVLRFVGTPTAAAVTRLVERSLVVA